MSEIKAVVYGLGGYDPDKPDNNIIEIEYYTDAEIAELAKAAEAAAAKAALLAKLSITEDEAKLLLS